MASLCFEAMEVKDSDLDGKLASEFRSELAIPQEDPGGVFSRSRTPPEFAHPSRRYSHAPNIPAERPSRRWFVRSCTFRLSRLREKDPSPVRPPTDTASPLGEASDLGRFLALRKIRIPLRGAGKKTDPSPRGEGRHDPSGRVRGHFCPLPGARAREMPYGKAPWRCPDGKKT